MLLLIYFLMYFQFWRMFCVLVCITFCPFYFCNHLEEEERTGCFAFIVLRMFCYCTCSVTPPHIAVGWSTVCDCGVS